MGHAKEISSEVRAQAVILRNQGLTYREIQQKLGISLCAVLAAIERFNQTQKYVSKKQSG